MYHADDRAHDLLAQSVDLAAMQTSMEPHNVAEKQGITTNVTGSKSTHSNSSIHTDKQEAY